MPPRNQPEEPIGFDEGWGQLSKFILRGEMIVFDNAGRMFTKDEYSAHYKIVYTMATQKPPMNFAEALYNQLMVEISAVAARRRSTARKQQIDLYAKLLGAIFKYIDRFYVSRVEKTPIAQVVENAFNLL
tara:strand:- start:201 stop:590 length:390 start_codon:yes stop_codon:yes gene_type:complete